ncbi:MAG TPA: PilZ domain-containing protein [Phycisphaerae bacterium]|nr:PilZ domain-containing protein [Phycisphaerae bacterium]
MRFVHELATAEIEEVMELFATQGLQATLTVRQNGRYVTFHAQSLARHGDAFWVQEPPTDHLPVPYEFRRDSEVGLSFTVGRRKYVAKVSLIRKEAYRLSDDEEATALKLAVPEQMHRIERRLSERLEMSSREIARASFWLGGQDARPVEESVSSPTWGGRVLNISTGGLLVRTTFEAARYVDTGDILGVQILLGTRIPATVVDAQVRHCGQDGEMAMIGMQFVHADDDPASNAGIEVIRGLIARQMADRGADR